MQECDEVPKRYKRDRRQSRSDYAITNSTKEFIAWDGEAALDAGYCLFGNSKGEYIRSKDIGSRELLEMICESGERHPSAFHVAFSFDYDVNQVIKDIGWIKRAVLHKTGRVKWNRYRIRHVPHKSFTVSRLDDKGNREVTVRIDDIFGYFRARYDKVLVKYGIGTKKEQELITHGKDERSTFLWKDILEIQTYWEMELRLMVQLMDALRSDINSAGYFIGQWHGPGALAAFALRKKGMSAFKQETPDDVLEAVRRAYSGGWFERYKVGLHIGPVHTADINSAYAYAISLLPNLANATWRYVANPPKELAATCRFGVFHVVVAPDDKQAKLRYLQTSQGRPAPLFMRDSRGGNTHPISVDGWYWNPEAALMRGDECAEFTEAWILDEDGTFPFQWVSEMYDERLEMIREENPAEKALKFTMASLYGRVAQRAGWDEKNRKAPNWHQLDWAGWITSVCRTMLYEASSDVALKDGLISNDTDGVMSTAPFGELRNGIGDGLGQWKLEEFDGVLYVQNGVYWLRKDDREWWAQHPEENIEGYPWIKPKMRGIPSGRITDPRKGPDLAIAALNGDGVIRFTRHAFVGYGAALRGRRESYRTWVDQPVELSAYNSGNRRHVPELCRQCQAGEGSMTSGLHDLALVLPSKNGVVESYSHPHKLPWLEPEGESVREMVKHMIDSGDV
jgi:hypothetical protein